MNKAASAGLPAAQAALFALPEAARPRQCRHLSLRLRCGSLRYSGQPEPVMRRIAWLLALRAAGAQDHPCDLTPATVARINDWILNGNDPGNNAFEALHCAAVTTVGTAVGGLGGRHEAGESRRSHRRGTQLDGLAARVLLPVARDFPLLWSNLRFS